MAASAFPGLKPKIGAVQPGPVLWGKARLYAQHSPGGRNKARTCAAGAAALPAPASYVQEKDGFHAGGTRPQKNGRVVCEALTLLY